jgi:hypothetical protein
LIGSTDVGSFISRFDRKEEGEEQMEARWNIFARELEDILRARGMQLSYLYRVVGIHAEKVRRLQRSLASPKSFVMLNPDEIELLVENLHLMPEELQRLRAAILATAVERTLIDRIDQDTALKAAELLYPMLLDSLKKSTGSQSGLELIR